MGQDIGRMIGGGGGESGKDYSYYPTEEDEEDASAVFNKYPRVLGGVLKPRDEQSKRTSRRGPADASSSSARVAGSTFPPTAAADSSGSTGDATISGGREEEGQVQQQDKTRRKDNALDTLDPVCVYLLISYLYMNEAGKLCLLSRGWHEKILSTAACLVHCKGLIIDDKVRKRLVVGDAEKKEEKERGESPHTDTSTSPSSSFSAGHRQTLLQTELSEVMVSSLNENRPRSPESEKIERDSSTLFYPHLSRLVISPPPPPSSSFSRRRSGEDKADVSLPASLPSSSSSSFTSSASSSDLIKKLLEYHASVLQALWIASSVSTSSSTDRGGGMAGGDQQGGGRVEQGGQHQGEERREDLEQAKKQEEAGLATFPLESMSRLEEIGIVGRSIDPVFAFHLLREIFLKTTPSSGSLKKVYLGIGPSSILCLHRALGERVRALTNQENGTGGEGLDKDGLGTAVEHVYINLGGYDGSLTWLVDLLDGLQQIFRNCTPHLEGTLVAKTSLLSSTQGEGEEGEDDEDEEEELSSEAVSTRDGTIVLQENLSSLHPPGSFSSATRSEEDSSKAPEKANADEKDQKKEKIVEALLGDEERRRGRGASDGGGGEQEEEEEGKRHALPGLFLSPSTSSAGINEKILLYSFWMPRYTRHVSKRKAKPSTDASSGLRGREQEEEARAEERKERAEGSVGGVEEHRQSSTRVNGSRREGEGGGAFLLYPPNDSLAALSPGRLLEIRLHISLDEDEERRRSSEKHGAIPPGDKRETRRPFEKCIYASFCSSQPAVLEVYKKHGKNNAYRYGDYCPSSMPALAVSPSFHALVSSSTARERQTENCPPSLSFSACHHVLGSTRTLVSAFDNLLIDIPLERIFASLQHGRRPHEKTDRSARHEEERSEKENLIQLLGKKNCKKICGFQLDLTNTYLQNDAAWDVHTLQQKIMRYIKTIVHSGEEEEKEKGKEGKREERREEPHLGFQAKDVKKRDVGEYQDTSSSSSSSSSSSFFLLRLKTEKRTPAKPKIFHLIRLVIQDLAGLDAIEWSITKHGELREEFSAELVQCICHLDRFLLRGALTPAFTRVCEQISTWRDVVVYVRQGAGKV